MATNPNIDLKLRYMYFDHPMRPPYTETTLAKFLQSAATEFILLKLRETDWHITNAAKSLGITRECLHKKIRELGLEEHR